MYFYTVFCIFIALFCVRVIQYFLYRILKCGRGRGADDGKISDSCCRRGLPRTKQRHAEAPEALGDCLVVLGPGGHTAEMLSLLEGWNAAKFRIQYSSSRRYVV